MRRISVLVTVILFSMLLAAQSFAAEQTARSLESFDFLIDASSTMKGSHGDLGRVLVQINEKIPDLGYPEAGIHTFAPEEVVLDMRPYDRGRFAQGIEAFMNKAPAGKGLDFAAPLYSEMLRNGAVIVFTDGNYKEGRDSVNEAKIFYLTQPNMCLHFVSFATDSKSQSVIDEMASLSPCSVSVSAGDLVDNEAATEDFVRRVFFGVNDGTSPVIDFVMLSIPFGFDSARLDPNTAKVADALAERLKAQPELMLKIDGYTCTIGNPQYNLGLSKRRAESVKQYIVNTGVAPSRITTESFGMSNPRYDNGTREGRSLNRRVEFTFFTQ